MNENHKHIWLPLAVISILFIQRVTVTEVDYEEPIPSSLYGPNDHITVLNSNNFDKKIYNKVSIFYREIT